MATSALPPSSRNSPTSSTTSPLCSWFATSATGPNGRGKSSTSSRPTSTPSPPISRRAPRHGWRRFAARSRQQPMHRLFVAIRPPEAIRDLLIDAMDDSPDFRWQEDEQLHLTLRFVGEVDRHVAADLGDALARVRAPVLNLRIKGVGSFD